MSTAVSLLLREAISLRVVPACYSEASLITHFHFCIGETPFQNFHVVLLFFIHLFVFRLPQLHYRNLKFSNISFFVYQIAGEVKAVGQTYNDVNSINSRIKLSAKLYSENCYSITRTELGKSKMSLG